MSSDVKDKLTTVGLVILGAIIFAIHVTLYIWNKYMFNVFVCLYVLVYSLLITIFLYRKKNCFDSTPGAFNVLTYFSIYTMVIQVLLVILSLIFLFMTARTQPSTYGYSPRYY